VAAFASPRVRPHWLALIFRAWFSSGQNSTFPTLLSELCAIAKFGLAFPSNHTRDLAQWAKLAEAKGWDGIFLGDAIWCEDPMIALAAAAVTTQRIRLGMMIVPVPLHQP
jgi:hypothetical protein